VAGCVTSTGFAGHAGATANLKLTFHPDHSVGANHLQAFALGTAKYELSLAEIRAIEVLLRKCVPDLVQTEIKADIMHRYVVEIPPLLSNAEWQEKYNGSLTQPTFDQKMIRQ
jgi:hypothetical protein